MARVKSQTNITANTLDILSLAVSTALLAALTQHVNHLNQVNQHLIATYLSRTAEPGFTVRPDFQLVPLAAIAIVLIAIAAAIRKRVSPLLLTSLAVAMSAGFVWLFGFRLVQL